jgi:heme-degrading monooxygenase HmoA
MNTESKRFVLMNVFTPKAGKLDEFLSLQTAALPTLIAAPRGARGGRLYRAEDGSKAVLLSVFDSAEDFQQFTSSDALAAHRRKLSDLLERSDPTRYELVYERGDV